MRSTTLTEIRHDHHVYHQARPSSEMLSPLPATCLRVVLLPSKACLFPFTEDILHQIAPELVVNLRRLLLVRSFRCGHVLFEGSANVKVVCGSDIAYQQILHNEVVHVDPNWTPPVIFIRTVKFILLAQTPNAIVTPQLLWVGNEI